MVDKVVLYRATSCMLTMVERAPMNDIRTPATPFQKREVGNFVLRTFLKIFAPYVTCYNTVNIRRPDISLCHV